MPPAPSRAAPLPREERRASIVAAFVPLLLERGPGVTTREVADAAGVAEGTLFKAFADKDDLIQAAVAVISDPTMFEHALAALDPLLDLEAQLVAATALLQRRIVDIWRVHGVLPQPPRTREPLQVSPGLVAIFSSHSDRISITPTAAALRLRAITLALTHPLLVEDAARPDEIVHQFLHGIAVREDGAGVPCGGVTDLVATAHLDDAGAAR